MDFRQHLHRLFKYDAWANRETLASLRACGTPPPRALRFLAHVIGAERLWLARLRRETSKLAVWPELTVAECEAEIAALAGEWPRFLDPRSPATLSEVVPYVNSKGERWENTVEDVLLHVTVHSAYHRGQVATEVRASGGEPAFTDFIHCVRQRVIE